MATNRISSALATLKNELKEIRNQDVQLMRDLIHINSTLQKLTSRPANYSGIFTRRANIKGQRKNSSGSVSSLDDMSSSSDSINSTGRSFPRVAMSIPGTDTNYSETQYHSILMTNVKVWKTSISDESASENEDDS